VSLLRDTRNAHEVLVGTYEAKKQFRRPRSRREDNIKAYLKQIK